MGIDRLDRPNSQVTGEQRDRRVADHAVAWPVAAVAHDAE